MTATRRAATLLVMTVSVLLADDQPMVRSGLALLLGQEPDLAVVGEASDGREAVERARELRPDVVLMDLSMPGMDGAEATRLLTADPAAPGASGAPAAPGGDRLLRVLVLTTFGDERAVAGALRSGASGFLLKHAAPAELVTAVRRVAAGETWIDQAVGRQVIAALAAGPDRPEDAAGRLAGLTAREREILELMAHGLSNGDIRDRLVLSEATVKTHVSRVIMKTGSRDRTQAVVLAYQSGLVVPGHPVRDTAHRAG
jgi:DNA-binding NarL/FixJ family response regulator